MITYIQQRGGLGLNQEVPSSPEGTGKKRYVALRSMMIVVTIAVIVLLVFLFYSFTPILGHSATSSASSSSTSQSTIQGIITGYVTVGPSQPVCSTNQSSCNVNLSGYSLKFSSQCDTTGSASSSTSCEVSTYSAPIAPSGHYSILLEPGNYTITGLSPSCSWVGCATTFPESVVVEGGQQLVVNINVDTGIR